jgi:hypothetical protein
MPATVHRLDTSPTRRAPRVGTAALGGPPPRREGPGFDFLTLVILLVGLAPFVGLALTRDWSPTELGLGAVMVIFSARAILVQRTERVRRGAPPPAP